MLCFTTVAVRVAYIVYDKPYYRIGGTEGQQVTVDSGLDARPAGWEPSPAVEIERAAANIARAGEIGNIYSNASGKSAHVSPLYPLFLGGLYWVFGWKTVAGRLAQELCAIAVTMYGFALLPSVAQIAGLSVFVGWVSAFVLAVLPVNLWLETCGSFEQPYSAVLLLGILFVFCRLRDEEWRRYYTILVAAVFLGIAALLSPNLLPAGALSILSEVVDPRGQRKRVVVASLVISCIVVVMLIPWTVRNYITFGSFIPFRSNFGLELAIGNSPGANGKTFATFDEKRENPSILKHPFTSAGELTHLQEIGEIAYMREKLSSALQWMRTNPGKTLELTGRRFRLFWFPPADMWAPSSPGRDLKVVVFSLIGFAALIDLVYLIVILHDRALLLIGTVIGSSLIYMLTHVDLRYRYPVFSLTSLLAFHLVWCVSKKVTQGQV